MKLNNSHMTRITQSAQDNIIEEFLVWFFCPDEQAKRVIKRALTAMGDR